MEKVMAVKALIGIIAIILMTGCGGSSGWRVSFGVSPVTAINDQQSLEQEKK